jgi:hypothetical protein
LKWLFKITNRKPEPKQGAYLFWNAYAKLFLKRLLMKDHTPRKGPQGFFESENGSLYFETPALWNEAALNFLQDPHND